MLIQEQREPRFAELDALIQAGYGEVDANQSERLLRSQLRTLRALGYTIIPPINKLHRHAPAFAATQIVAVVSRRYKLTPDRLRKRSNHAAVVLPRSLAMWAMYHWVDMSYPQIGRFFGGMHHTTVRHAERKIEALREADPEIRRVLDEIEQEAGK